MEMEKLVIILEELAETIDTLRGQIACLKAENRKLKDKIVKSGLFL